LTDNPAHLAPGGPLGHDGAIGEPLEAHEAEYGAAPRSAKRASHVGEEA
jgi:hypothetical protein